MARPRTPKSVLDDVLVGTLAAAVRPAEISDMRRTRMWLRIAARVSPPPPPGTYTVRADDASGWQVIDPRVQLKVLREDRANNNRTVLIRMAPGGVIVPHRHSQEEECLVLDGAIEIGAHILTRGDVHIAKPGAAHERITSRSGALLMIRAEIPPSHFSIV